MSFDISTAIPVDVKPEQTKTTGNFDIASARPVDAPGGKTDWEKFNETMDTVYKAGPQGEKTPGLDKAITEHKLQGAQDPGFLKTTAILGMENLAELATKPLGIEMQGLKEDKEELSKKHEVAAIIAGTAPFIATAPLFPAGLVGLSSQFAAVSGLSELGRQSR
jgi:hypothetical protein